jgi:hypothetical protein
MKIALYLLAAVVLSINSVCFAYDPPPQANNPGEIIFFTEESISEVEPIQVTCTLAGVVFNNTAVWNDDVSSQHTEYGTYLFPGTSTYNNRLRGSTHELTTSRNLVSWESVYEGDAVADVDECTGMVGWGVYSFNLHLQGSQSGDIYFTLNTLDGRWMYENGADDPTNKFIFKVTREQDGTLTLELFNWNLGFFVEVETQSTVFYWSNNVTGSRFREGLNSATLIPFILNRSETYPLGCESALIDVHLRCEQSLVIGSGKSIFIEDFLNPNTQTTESTILRFHDNKGLLLSFDNNANSFATLHVLGHRMGSDHSIIFAHASYDGTQTEHRSLWLGINAYRSQPNQSSYNISLKHCMILNAKIGLYVENTPQNAGEYQLEIDSCRIRYADDKAVHTISSNINLTNSEIDDCMYGVIHDYYSYNHTNANRIHACRIEDIEFSGIQVRSHTNPYSVQYGRPEKLSIQGNFLQDCEYHGITIYESLSIIAGNHISASGGTKSNETPPAGYSGLLAVWSDISFHANLVETNTAYGLQADNNSLVRGNYLNFNLGDGGYGGIDNYNLLLQGRNCFVENDFNVGASNNVNPVPGWDNTKIILGQRASLNEPFGLEFVGHGNSFVNPTQDDNPLHLKYQMTAEQGSKIWAYRNFWSSDDPSEPVSIESSAKIYRESTLPDVDDTCERFLSPQSGRIVSSSAQGYSDDAELILTRILLGLTDDAASMTYGSIDAGLDSAEIGIRTLALRTAYIYDYDSVARDTLRKYALWPHDPGETVNLLTSTALVDLITAEILVDNWEGAVLAIDTLLTRQTPALVKARFLAEKASYFFRSTADSIHISIIDSLLSVYPNENSILLTKYMISLDSTLLGLMSKSGSRYMDDRHVTSPRIVTFPNPAVGNQTILVSAPDQLRSVSLLDQLGRTVASASWSYVLANHGVQLSYSLPSGMYFLALGYPDNTVFCKILIARR